MLTLHRKLCLASSSPRRHEFLNRFGLTFENASPDILEVQKEGESVVDFCFRMAHEKAQAIAPQFPESIILAGDTTVLLGQQTLGKPRDAQDAFEMLHAMSGKSHEVYSAYILLDATSGRYIDDCVSTLVHFKELTPQWIQWYIDTGEPLDKAGAYSIQGVGTMMVDRIEGSYNNVVGFPIENIIQHLLQENWISFA